MKNKCTHKNFTKKMSCKWYFAGICLLKKHEHNEDVCKWEKKGPYNEQLTYGETIYKKDYPELSKAMEDVRDDN